MSTYLGLAVVDNAVSLVTSAHEGTTNVMTASFFAESSHVPVLLRVSIAEGTLTHRLIGESGWFGLSILVAGQEAWAIGCGEASGRDGSKFDRLGIPWIPGPRGVPLLPDCLTTSECRVVERVGLPGHTLFVGEVAVSFRQPRLAGRRKLLVSDLTDTLRP